MSLHLAELNGRAALYDPRTQEFCLLPEVYRLMRTDAGIEGFWGSKGEQPKWFPASERFDRATIFHERDTRSI